MIADFFFMMLVLGLTVPVYWFIGARHDRLRRMIVIGVSVGFLWLLSPLILLSVSFFLAVLHGFLFATKKSAPPAILKRLSWLIFLPMFFTDYVRPDWLAAGLLGEAALNVPSIAGFAFLGMSYTAIRTFILVREGIGGRIGNPLAAAQSLFFFGSFSAGPIVGASAWNKPTGILSPDDALMALARIGWGSAVFLVIVPWIADIDLAPLIGGNHDQPLIAWFQLYRRFITLYLNFAGYTDIAIGCALLFGVTLPENFNFPLVSSSIQEFWQRWHQSLGAFIGSYLFKPIVRSTGKPWLAIFLAFIGVGLWHESTWPYLLWGIGHGAALAINMAITKSGKLSRLTGRSSGLVRIAGWAFTMTYVALLSQMANSENLTQALSDFLKLAGIRS